MVGLRAAGFAIYAAVPGAAVALDDLDFSRPAAVMVGNEHEGLTAEAIAAADVRFGIPMHGLTQSLNLSVATALIVERASAIRRQRAGEAQRSRTTPRCSSCGRASTCRLGARRRGGLGARRAGRDSGLCFLKRVTRAID